MIFFFDKKIKKKFKFKGYKVKCNNYLELLDEATFDLSPSFFCVEYMVSHTIGFVQFGTRWLNHLCRLQSKRYFEQGTFATTLPGSVAIQEANHSH
jgi:hypothetical protein